MTADHLAEVTGFEVRADGPTWHVRTREGAAGISPRLLSVEYVARAGAPAHELGFLEEWQAQDDGPDPAVISELERLSAGEQGINQFLYGSQLIFLCAADSELPALVRANLIGSLDTSLPDYRVVFLKYDRKVHGRTAFVRSLLAAHHAPDWLNWSADRGFGALSTFAGGVFMGDTTILDPLLAATFPWLYGMSMTRVGAGLAAVLFGTVLPWRPGIRDADLGEMLLTSHLVEGPVVRVPPTPEVAVEDAVLAVRWWAEQADRLLGLFTDPTLFGADGTYDPRSHAAALANLERVFASVIAGLGHTGRDEYTRQLHMFEVLDILEGFSMGGYDTTLSHARCSEILVHLESTLPPAVGRVLLPRCRAAVDALLNVREGFIPERRTADGVRLVSKQGAEEIVTLDKAATRVLRQVRNAGHGLQRAVREPQHFSVLTSHTGSITPAISDVGFLHLVNLLARPEVLETKFERQAGTAS